MLNVLFVNVSIGLQNLLQDPMYNGLRQKRVTGVEYEEFMDEFMRAAVRKLVTKARKQKELSPFEICAEPDLTLYHAEFSTNSKFLQKPFNAKFQ